MHQLNIFDQANRPVKHLRNYQKSAINSVLEVINTGKKSCVLTMPTGSGKSFCLANLLLELKADNTNTLVLVPRRKLKRQLRLEFESNGLKKSLVQTAQSLTDAKLFQQGYYQNLKYIILDECHELAWWKPIEKLRMLNHNAFVLGLTATPDRSSKKEFIEDKFESIIYPISFGELVDDAYLCNPRYFSYGNQLDFNQVETDVDGMFVQEQLDKQCEKRHFNESIVRNLVKHNLVNRKSIVFCSSIKQSKTLADMLCNAGIPAIHVDGSMTETSQELAINQVANGDIASLCCAKLLIAGFDEPRIDAVVLATATNSRQNLVQMCGRGSRIHPDKDDEFWVFDFGDNFARLKIGLKQKFPYKCRYDAKETRQSTMKACPSCGYLVYSFVMVCPECGELFPKKDKPILDLQDMDVIEVEADLQDIYHIKNIRKTLRDSYMRFDLPFLELSAYVQNHRIKNIKHIAAPSQLRSSVFKQKNISNLLDFVWYCDYHTHRLRTNRLYKHEIKYLQKFSNEDRQYHINEWIKLIDAMPSTEFANYINSRAVKKYLGNGRWQDVLGVLDFDSKETMLAAYKKKWQEISDELHKLIDFKDGEIDPDRVAQIIEKSDNKEIEDLRNRSQVLEWAYKYMRMLHP